MTTRNAGLPIQLVGDGLEVPCLDGQHRPFLGLDAAASTAALPAVARRVSELLPWYSSVNRGAGYKSQLATAAYDDAHAAILRFAGRTESDDVAIVCRNTTEALNHLAHSLDLAPTDVVVTTVVEHHSNLLPWRRVATCRYVECNADGTFDAEAARRALRAEPRPRLLTLTGASNISGWIPPLDEIITAAHELDVPVVIDAAQLAAHRPLPAAADFLAFSGHKMYAPFGAGALIGPRTAFERREPFLVGGGAVALVDLDTVAWNAPPAREEAGSPNVIGAVALAAAAAEMTSIGWEAIRRHDAALALRLRTGLAAIPGVRLLGPAPDAVSLPIAPFTVEGAPHELVAARLSAEFAIGVRHGRFCAHPYLVRLLGLGPDHLKQFRDAERRRDPGALPGAARASAGLSTTLSDVDRLLDAVAAIAASGPPPVEYAVDRLTGEHWPPGFARPDGLAF